MSFYTLRLPYQEHVPQGEPNDGSTVTEQSGAATSEQQIKLMFQAGEKLSAWRDGYFDYRPGQEVDAVLPDMPVRQSNFDLVDAQLRASYLSGRLSAYRSARAKELATKNNVDDIVNEVNNENGGKADAEVVNGPA